MKTLVEKILSKIGIQIRRYPDFDLVRRMKIVNQYHINTLIDIGANAGQYAVNMRKIGYCGKIISFEPLKSAFAELKKNSSKDNNWIVNNYALGNENAESRINFGSNSFFSSILNMLPTVIKSAPEAVFTSQEEIEIKKIDTVFNSFCTKKDSVMIKIDTQGYEKNVLEGATESLKNIKIIQIEMSLVRLYENEMLFLEVINYLYDKGFQLFSLENGFSDSTTGRLLQVDGIFVQKERS